jgi:hypothetical protein
MFKRRLAAVLSALMLASMAMGAISTVASAAPVTCVDDTNPTQLNKGGQCK